jgi:hypothetical protein
LKTARFCATGLGKKFALEPEIEREKKEHVT